MGKTLYKTDCGGCNRVLTLKVEHDWSVSADGEWMRCRECEDIKYLKNTKQ